MDNVLLVMVNLDDDSFFDKDGLLEEIEKYRKKKDLDLSLLSLYSVHEEYYVRHNIKKLYKSREPYPKLVFSKTFLKNDGNLTSLYMTKRDKNKEYIYSYMMKYLSKIIDVGGVLIFDNNLRLTEEELKKCFGSTDFKVEFELPKQEDLKTLKRTIF